MDLVELEPNVDGEPHDCEILRPSWILEPAHFRIASTGLSAVELVSRAHLNVTCVEFGECDHEFGLNQVVTSETVILSKFMHMRWKCY